MTLGRLRCIGTASELISKYGSGFNSQVTFNIDEKDKVIEKLKELYDGMEILEVVGNQMRLAIPKVKELHEIFEDLEKMYI